MIAGRNEFGVVTIIRKLLAREFQACGAWRLHPQRELRHCIRATLQVSPIDGKRILPTRRSCSALCANTRSGDRVGKTQTVSEDGTLKNEGVHNA